VAFALGGKGLASAAGALARQRARNKHDASVGDTAHTVRIFAQAHPHMRCDLAHPSVPSREHSDLLALRAMSHIPGAYVMPTALGSQSVLYGLTGLWEDALRSSVIKNSTCRPAIRPRSVGADFRFANSNTVIDHIFCTRPPLENLTIVFIPLT
jgi:hypothetical protein